MMTRMKELFGSVALTAFILAPSVGWSASVFVQNATITKILQDSVNYGGCMARLSKSLVAEGLNCPADPFVTFDCLGKLGGSKSAGVSTFSGAQLAFVSGSIVDVVVDDSKKINGFCYGRRVDVR